MAEGVFQIHKCQFKYMMKLFAMTFCWCELIATSVALQQIKMVIHTDFKVRTNEHLAIEWMAYSIFCQGQKYLSKF